MKKISRPRDSPEQRREMQQVRRLTRTTRLPNKKKDWKPKINENE